MYLNFWFDLRVSEEPSCLEHIILKSRTTVPRRLQAFPDYASSISRKYNGIRGTASELFNSRVQLLWPIKQGVEKVDAQWIQKLRPLQKGLYIYFFFEELLVSFFLLSMAEHDTRILLFYNHIYEKYTTSCIKDSSKWFFLPRRAWSFRFRN